MEREWARGEYDPWTDRVRREGTTAIEALELFLEDRRRSGCAPSTVDTYDAVIRPLLDGLGPTFPLYGVEDRHIRRYLARPARQQNPNSDKPPKPRSEATKKSYGDRIRIFLAWCVDEKLITTSPAPAPSKGKEGRRRDLPEFLSPDDYDRLLRAIEGDAELKGLDHGNRWLLDAVRFAVGTGLRRGELCALRWGAVDLAGRMLHVRNEGGFTTKSGRERAVPLVGEAHAVAARLDEERHARGLGHDRSGLVLSGADGGALSGSYVSKRFRKYRRARRAAGGVQLPQPPAHVRVVVGPARRRPLPAEGGAGARRHQDDDEVRAPPAGVTARGGGAHLRPGNGGRPPTVVSGRGVGAGARGVGAGAHRSYTYGPPCRARGGARERHSPCTSAGKPTPPPPCSRTTSSSPSGASAGRGAHAALNVAGLTLGLACCLVLFQYVAFELSFDQFHEHEPDLYRVTTATTRVGEAPEPGSGAFTPQSLAPALAEAVPEVLHVARVHPEYNAAVVWSPSNPERVFEEEGAFYADPAFLKMFTFPLVAGDAETALAEPGTAARLGVGGAEVLRRGEPRCGQVLDWTGSVEGSYRVAGVFEDVPANSHLQFDFLLPVEDLLREGQYAEEPEDGWSWNNFATYVQLHPGADRTAVGRKIEGVYEAHRGEALRRDGWTLRAEAQPLRDVHLNASVEGPSGQGEGVVMGSYRTVYFFTRDRAGHPPHRPRQLRQPRHGPGARPRARGGRAEGGGGAARAARRPVPLRSRR